MCDAEIVEHVRVILFPLRCFAIFADRFSVLTEARISLSEIVMSFGIVVIISEILLISFNCLFIFLFGFFLFAQRLVAQRKAEMCFSKVRIQTHCLRERLHSLLVLIVPVQFLSFVQKTAGLSPITS